MHTVLKRLIQIPAVIPELIGSSTSTSPIGEPICYSRLAGPEPGAVAGAAPLQQGDDDDLPISRPGALVDDLQPTESPAVAAFAI
ncbi:hypothetical protein EYF80_034303 [Liparis tanakae]|uniref:Uncharacterized protein n=1 Tax=Liparis tanakae TaxID=230148 RepID=A0A4Z2GQA7_9TELE|nr:hypothetical protein EYF80_034303 [Liparis tanakae]